MSDEADGSRRIYRLDPGGVGAMRAYLDRFWNQSLAAFKAAAEQTHRRKHDHAAGRNVGDAPRSSSRRRSSTPSRCSRRHRHWWPETTTSSRANSRRWSSSPASAATSATSPPTGTSAAGRACSSTSRRRASCSAGTSACGGRSRPTPTALQRGRGALHAQRRARTLVELEHRHIDRHGEGWERMRDAVGSPGGWDLAALRRRRAGSSERRGGAVVRLRRHRSEHFPLDWTDVRFENTFPVADVEVDNGHRRASPPPGRTSGGEDGNAWNTVPMDEHGGGGGSAGDVGRRRAGRPGDRDRSAQSPACRASTSDDAHSPAVHLVYGHKVG